MLHGPQPGPVRKQQDREARQPVAETPDDGIDERLDGQCLIGRHGQIQQLDGRLVHGVPQHLVGAAQHHSGRQRADDQQPAGPQRQRHGHDKQREAQARPAQQASGEDPLQRKRQQPGVEVEHPEERRQLVAPDGRLTDDGLELPTDHGRGPRRQEDHGGNGAQVGRAGNQGQALAQPRVGVFAVVLRAVTRQPAAGATADPRARRR